jgi:hypothetical protein
MATIATPWEFIPESHTYVAGGRVVPSVTQVLDAVGLISYDHIPQAILDHKADVGTAAHAACHFLDEGELDWQTVDPEVEPYVRAWELFRNQTDFAHELVEHRGISEVDGMQFGFTLDRTGTFRGKPVLIEIKCTSNVELSWGPQTAAYAMAQAKLDGQRRFRMATHLKPNGTYALIPFSQVGDFQIFKAALAIETWKRRMHGHH